MPIAHHLTPPNAVLIYPLNFIILPYPYTPPISSNLSNDTPEHQTMPSQQVFQSKDGATYTTSNGAPHPGSPYSASRVGSNGPLLLQGMDKTKALSPT